MKKNKLKSLLFHCLDFLPEKLGFMLYHSIQKKLTSPFRVKVEANIKSFEKLEKLLAKNGGLKNRTVLEIGSGWMPIMPYLLKYNGGVRTIFSYDINEHYDNHYIDKLNIFCKEEFGAVEKIENEKYNIPPFVKYYPKGNVITANLPKQIDVIFSRFVLEHVTPRDILLMHQRFAKEYGENVFILHLISPSDHRAFSDSSISHYDFLKYSEDEWNNIQTKFDYHNRLRLPQYLDLFEQAGMEVIYLENDKAKVESTKHNKFKQLKIHQDFSKFTEEELTAGSLNVLLRPRRIHN